MRFAPAIVAARGGIPLRAPHDFSDSRVRYWDPVNGVDANSGLTFAMRKKTLSQFTTPNAKIRCIESGRLVDMGVTAKWEDLGKLPAAVAITSSTNATPIVVTLVTGTYNAFGGTGIPPAVGDTVCITGHTTNTNANGFWEISVIDAVNFKVTLINADGSNSVGNGAGGASGTIQKINNRRVILSAAANKNIACCGNQGIKTNWTPSANITATVVTNIAGAGTESVEAQQLAANGTFTTGLVAFFATGTLDLSAYTRISFVLHQSAGTAITAGALQVTLCSDAAGLTPVNTFNIPAFQSTNQNAIVLDNAAPLGSSILSIAITAVSTFVSRTIIIDNFVACKALTDPGGLSIQSLLTKGGVNEGYWPIQSINDRRVMLGRIDILPGGSTNRGYSSKVNPGGGSETVNLYRMEGFFTTDGTTIVNTTGTGGTPQTISGGWDADNMSAQRGESFFVGHTQNGNTAFTQAASTVVTFPRIGIARYNTAMNVPGTATLAGLSGWVVGVNLLSAISANGGFSYGVDQPLWLTCSGISESNRGCNALGDLYIFSSPLSCTFTSGSVPHPHTGTLIASNSAASGLGGSITCSLNNAICSYNASYGIGGAIAFVAGAVRTLTANGNGIDGVNFGNSTVGGVGSGFICDTFTGQNNVGFALAHVPASTGGGQAAGPQFIFGEINASGNGSGTISETADSSWYVRRFNSTDTTKLTATYTTGWPYSQLFYLDNYGGVAGDSRVYQGSVLLSQMQSTVTYSAGSALKVITNANHTREVMPASVVAGAYAVAANVPVTITCRCLLGNPSADARINVKAGQLTGVAAVTSTVTIKDTTTWELLTMSFTPTASGVVQVYAEIWGPSGAFAYFDDLRRTL